VVNQTRLRVRYAETDQMGVAYHSNYLIWFEVGRVELMRQHGCAYREMEEREGCYIAVVDARCRYKAPARYDDELVVSTRIGNVRGPLINFLYEVARASDGTLLAEGETTHLVTDAKMQRRALPERYATVLAAAVSNQQ